MKGLSLWQPWATLVAIGAKKIETRSWETAYRGELAIHATKNMPAEAKALCSREPFCSALGNVFDAEDLPLGAIIAVVELKACYQVPDTSHVYPIPGFEYFNLCVVLPPSEPERSFGDYTPGRYGWILANVRMLERPIPCRGYQQLWDVPADIQAQIKEQLA